MAISLFACSSKKSTSISQLANGQYSISHDSLSFLIDPNVGGRVLSAKFNEKELLLQPREELLNYGATLWPAPQSIWNWPPPYAIHYGPYASEIIDNKLILTSETDAKTGLGTSKTFGFNDSKGCLEITYTFLNATDSIISVGPWEIVCVPAIGSKVFFPMGSTPENADTTFTFEKQDGIGWFDYDPEKLDENQKLFNNASEGWLAHINADGLLFVKTFDKIPAEKLAPGQGNVEVYVSKAFGYIELENHGEFMNMAPGESLECHVQWYLSQLPGPLSGNGYNPDLIAHIRSLIK